MLLSDKRGISVIIGYVLLISIAVIMSAVVYAWMKSYVPVENAECSDGVSVLFDTTECSEGKLIVRIENNGLFNVDGMFLRASLKPIQEIATFDLTSGELGNFIRFGGGLAPERFDITRNFSYVGSACDEGATCETKNICLGGKICERAKQKTQCDQIQGMNLDCEWIGDDNLGKCVGTARCEFVDSTICATLSSLELGELDSYGYGENKACHGMQADTPYYYIYNVEAIPIIFDKVDGKNKFASCGKAKIKQDVKDCMIFAVR